jgi:hypothetical protein
MPVMCLIVKRFHHYQDDNAGKINLSRHWYAKYVVSQDILKDIARMPGSRDLAIGIRIHQMIPEYSKTWKF